uniref:Uncharacterized protein n=1 Tax=Lepeophtheirus salmonis TaxID=72036 RepID=A0A0K2UP67_LEPSM
MRGAGGWPKSFCISVWRCRASSDPSCQRRNSRRTRCPKTLAGERTKEWTTHSRRWEGRQRTPRRGTRREEARPLNPRAGSGTDHCPSSPGGVLPDPSEYPVPAVRSAASAEALLFAIRADPVIQADLSPHSGLSRGNAQGNESPLFEVEPTQPSDAEDPNYLSYHELSLSLLFISILNMALPPSPFFLF